MLTAVGLLVYNPALNLQLFRAIIRLLWYNSNRAQLMVPLFVALRRHSLFSG